MRQVGGRARLSGACLPMVTRESIYVRLCHRSRHLLKQSAKLICGLGWPLAGRALRLSGGVIVAIFGTGFFGFCVLVAPCKIDGRPYWSAGS